MSKQDFSFTPQKTRIHYDNASPSPDAQPDLVHGDLLTGRVPHVSLLARPGTPPEPVAVLICHGMGQQVRFETIGQIAAAILKEATAQGCTAIGTGVQISLQNESFLARAELNWTTPKGKLHSVHVYEAYWAPITEGKVSYWDTVRFLFSAAWKGIRSSSFFRASDFERYLFDGLQKLRIYAITRFALVAVAAFLVAQLTVIGLVLAKLADQLKQIEASHFAIRQIAIILLPGIHTIRDPKISGTQHVFAALALIGWYLLVAEILIARYFLIQYVGSVAAYISPYKDSKFDEIRTQIQHVGLNVAKVIYGFSNTSIVPNYERVVIAGHSLGSVLAYDTLNAIINLDNTSATPGSQRVFKRTTNLITFGSPLDKTAFLFRNQSNHVKDPLREQMSAAMQPLILDYKLYRKPYFWTNIYSKRDIISGSLDYYDLPSDLPDPSLHVQNCPDPQANVPLYAHVQYWKNSLLAKTLYKAVQ